MSRRNGRALLRKQLTGTRGSRRGGFLDAIFAPLRRQRTAPSRTIGVGGSAVYGGFLQTEERDTALQGREKYRTYSEILANTTIVGAGVRLFLNLVARAGWKAEPAEDGGARAVELAELVEEALFDMTTPWHRVVRRTSMHRFWGFSVQEWTANRRDDGSVGFLDVEPRPQITIERWDLDESGTVMGVVQRSPQTQEEIYLPRGRLVYACDDSLHDSPEGLGIFRHLVRAARHLDRFEQLEGLGFETSLDGVPIGRGPFQELQDMVDKGDITADEKMQYERGLCDFVQKRIYTEDRGILLDSKTYETEDDKSSPSAQRLWDVELLQSGAQGQTAVAATIERLNREIARVLGVEHLLLGPTSGGGSGSGSFALAKSKADVFALIVANTLQELSETFEADLVVPLFQMNGWDEALAPTLKPEAVQHRDVEQVTGALRDLAQSANAVGPQDEAFGEVFDLLGLTRPEVDEMAADAAISLMPQQEEDLDPGGEDADEPGDDEVDAEDQPEAEETSSV